MPFRNRAPEPDPPWKQRAERAAATIVHYRHDAPAVTHQLLANVHAALMTAAADRDQLERVLADIDGDQIRDELKTALRARTSALAPDTPLIRSLRERHESHHHLLNRLAILAAQIEQTVVDLETAAARAVEVSFTAATRTESIDADLQRLNDDLIALAAAHRDVAEL